MTPPPPLQVLVFNSGSSSLKFALLDVDGRGAVPLWWGAAEAIAAERGRFHLRNHERVVLDEAAFFADAEGALRRIVSALAAYGLAAPDMVAHRIVHGGPALRHAVVIDTPVLRQLDAACAFAPVHGLPALAVVRLALATFAAIPHVACFDTSFHVTLPALARTLPIAAALRDAGIERYGFHGLSCASIVRKLGAKLPARVVIAHLGGGASLTAIKHGKSIDTSMGLTPSGGVTMGTRSGDLDPGVLIYLLREKRYDTAMLEELIDHRSGLLGISGISGDMRELHAVAATHPAAQLAIAVFCYAVRKQIAAMSAALEGLDLLVFTGGIGEHDGVVRAMICAGLAWLGIALDEARNRAGCTVIGTQDSRCAIRVERSEEAEQIALDAWALLCADQVLASARVTPPA